MTSQTRDLLIFQHGRVVPAARDAFVVERINDDPRAAHEELNDFGETIHADSLPRAVPDAPFFRTSSAFRDAKRWRLIGSPFTDMLGWPSDL